MLVFCYKHIFNISSVINTPAQQNTATLNKPALHIAAIIPIINATKPDMGFSVAVNIAGNVITANVTKGT